MKTNTKTPSEHYFDPDASARGTNDASNNDGESRQRQQQIISARHNSTTRSSSIAPPINKKKNMMLKNVFLLSGMWGMGLGAAFVQIPSAQNVLTSNNYDSISTVPLGIIILGSSPMAVWIPKLMQRCGEKPTFVIAAVLGVFGSLIQMTGLLLSQNPGSTLEITTLIIGAAVQSFTYASTNNIRFAVAYFSTKEFLPKATAFVILGGAVGAVIGPLLTNTTRYLCDNAEYAGNFLQLAIMYLLYGMFAIATDFPPPSPQRTTKKNNTAKSSDDAEKENSNSYSNEIHVVMEEGVATQFSQETDDDESSSTATSIIVTSVDTTTEDQTIRTKDEGRSIKEILISTDLAVLIVVQSMSYNIMAMYMGCIKFPMKENGYDDDLTTYAIFAHQLGMFLPSLVSGHIIDALGTWPTTCIGFLTMVLAGGLFYISTSLELFIIGITIVGVGWNLSFVGPSAALADVYKTDNEKSIVQGLNDGIMLGSVGILQLSAATIYDATGPSWNYFNGIWIGFSILCTILTFIKAAFVRSKE